MAFDKVTWTPQAEDTSAMTVLMFFAHTLRNDPTGANIHMRTYQLERTLGSDASGVMSQYILGAQPDSFTINIPQADKVTIDFKFTGLDQQQYSGAVALKGGTRPAAVLSPSINTSQDITRIKTALVNAYDAAYTPLFMFGTEAKITLNNNITVNKAIGVFGGFSTTAGLFELGGSQTAYFGSVDAMNAIRSNSNVTMDIIIQKPNQAMVIDIPLMTLGNGVLDVQLDKAIMLPIDQSAVQSPFGHTFMFQHFPYLPV